MQYLWLALLAIVAGLGIILVSVVAPSLINSGDTANLFVGIVLIIVSVAGGLPLLKWLALRYAKEK